MILAFPCRECGVPEDDCQSSPSPCCVVCAEMNTSPHLSTKWESRTLGLAREVSTWSSCTRDKVGAVVFDPVTKDIVSVGFNDTAPGLPNCGEGGCPRAGRDCVPGSPYLDDEECLHAEDNALQRAGHRARGAWLVVTRTPCGNCRRRALTAGIARTVVWSGNTETPHP